jgi:type II secretory pathway component PulF
MTNEEQILAILKENQEILKTTYKSAEKTRKYFLYSAIITILMFVLPLIGLIIVIPMFMKTYMETLNGLI